MSAQLLLSKRLFIEGCNYAESNDPVSCGIAISMFQDSVELYIWSVIKDKGLTVKDQAGFLSNIETLQKAEIKVPNTSMLQELNKARVGFKHYGNLPAPEEAKKYQGYLEDFLRLAMQEHFEINFDELSLVDLVANSTIRDHLKLAEKNINENLLQDAVTELAKAKYVTFSQLKQIIPEVDYGLKDLDKVISSIEGSRVGKIGTYLFQYLNSIRTSSLAAMLNLPIRDYQFLQNYLPSASQTGSGKWSIHLTKSKYDESDCRHALKCIVNLCLRIEQAK